MPSNVLKALADKAGVSMDKAEKYWDEAKAAAHCEENDGS